MKTIEEIKKEVLRDKDPKTITSDFNGAWILARHDHLWPEVCKRYAIEVTKPISELLAVMHGDGGHYTAKHGLVKSVEDAIELLHAKWKSPDQVKDECFKVAKASLEKASENAEAYFTGLKPEVVKESITDEKNIVL